MGKSKTKQAAQVPECRFGAACTRKDCIYRHPPKKPAASKACTKAAAAPPESDKVCFAFVAGRCQFGRHCRDKHPDESSCRTIRERYARMDCQWGANCRTEGCLYRHPTFEAAGPPLSKEPPRIQPAVFAAGPVIVPTNMAVDEPHRVRHNDSIPIPKAMLQSVDLRNTQMQDAFNIVDPMERFHAVNAHNCGSRSAALLDLYYQSALTFQSVLDTVLPERLRMFASSGVWIMTGSAAASRGRGAEGSLFEAVREYLLRNHYEFALGHTEDGSQCAFCVIGRREDPLQGVRAVLLCGVPGSGKTALAQGLVNKSAGRFRCVSQEDRSLCEKAWRSELASAAESAERSKAGSWWWDKAFNAEKHYLVVCFRTSALSFLAGYGARLPQSSFVHATIAYQPTGLDLRRWLGRPVTVTFRSFMVLECTAAPNVGEVCEAILCIVRERPEPGAPAKPSTTLHIPLTAPRAAARHLQVLNALPTDKRIMANSTVGSFRVKQVIDLHGDLLGLCTLMHKAGDSRDTPVGMSFDALVLNSAFVAEADLSQAPRSWTDLGKAAMASLDSLTILADGDDGASKWNTLVAAQCAEMKLQTPKSQVLRLVPSETKVAQWMRLRSKCLLHCTAEEADIPHFINEGAAVLRSPGGAVLPPVPSKEASSAEMQKIVILDRCNLERAERKQWLEAGNLSKSEAVAVYIDSPDVPSHIVRVEPPSDQENFRSVVRLKATAAASQDLIRKLTGESRCAKPFVMQANNDSQYSMLEEEANYDEYEALPPAMATLNQWIEVEEQGHQFGAPPGMWGMSSESPIDFPLELLPGNFDGGYALGPTPGPASGSDAMAGYYDEERQAASDEAGHLDVLLQRAQERFQPDAGNRPLSWDDSAAVEQGLAGPWLGARAPDPTVGPMASSTTLADEDEEDPLEQLAATLRCMGFDEEASLEAANRAGGNLNVAVESMLGQGSAPPD